MSRIIDHKELLFPVLERPIFTCAQEQGGAIPIPGRKAILDANTLGVLGVVGRDYHLVSNRKACEYARKCASAVFPETVEEEWEIFGADAPQSRTYCHIDLKHKTGKLDFDYVMVGTREEVPDTYGPYIRVTNSYNGRRALKFTIGCYRKVCKNGMTAPGEVISFSYSHTRGDIGPKIRFVVDHESVRKMRQDFKDAFETLRRQEVERKDAKDLVKVVLAITMPAKAEDKDDGRLFNAFQSDWFRLDGYIDSLIAKYADRLGENAYSVLQAATDLASHPLENSCLRKDKHGLQRLAGEWLVDFRRQCAAPGFDLGEYLKRSSHAHVDRTRSGRYSATTE